MRYLQVGLWPGDTIKGPVKIAHSNVIQPICVPGDCLCASVLAALAAADSCSELPPAAKQAVIEYLECAAVGDLAVKECASRWRGRLMQEARDMARHYFGVRDASYINDLRRFGADKVMTADDVWFGKSMSWILELLPEGERPETLQAVCSAPFVSWSARFLAF